MMDLLRRKKEQDRSKHLIHGREDTHPQKFLNFERGSCINNQLRPRNRHIGPTGGGVIQNIPPCRKHISSPATARQSANQNAASSAFTGPMTWPSMSSKVSWP